MIYGLKSFIKLVPGVCDVKHSQSRTQRMEDLEKIGNNCDRKIHGVIKKKKYFTHRNEMMEKDGTQVDRQACGQINRLTER